MYVRNLLNFDLENLFETVKNLNFLQIFVPIIFYFFGHFLRAFRLYFLSNNTTTSFNNLFKKQIQSNTINLIVPFKLGESYRVIAFSKLLGNSYRSFSTLVIERTLDVFVLFIYLSIGIYISDKIKISDISFIYFPVFFVILSILTIVVISKDTLLIIQKRILQRYKGQKSKRLLKLIAKLSKNYISLEGLVYNKILQLMTLSFIIWGFELIVLLMFYNFFNLEIDIILILGVLIAFSGLLPNGPAGLGGIQLAFYFTATQFNLITEDFISMSYLYSFIIFGSAIFIGLISFLTELYNKIHHEKKQYINSRFR